MFSSFVETMCKFQSYSCIDSVLIPPAQVSHIVALNITLICRPRWMLIGPEVIAEVKCHEGMTLHMTDLAGAAIIVRYI